MTRVLAVDPGSHVAGYAVLEVTQRTPRALEWGVVEAGRGLIGPRLLTLYNGIISVLDDFKPGALAIEEVHSKSAWAKSGLVLSEARGVILLAAAQRHVPAFHYSPSFVKMTIAGRGNADKGRVRRFVEMQLGIDLSEAQYDESDALAIGLTHCYRNDIRKIA